MDWKRLAVLIALLLAACAPAAVETPVSTPIPQVDTLTPGNPLHEVETSKASDISADWLSVPTGEENAGEVYYTVADKQVLAKVWLETDGSVVVKFDNHSRVLKIWFSTNQDAWAVTDGYEAKDYLRDEANEIAALGFIDEGKILFERQSGDWKYLAQ